MKPHSDNNYKDFGFVNAEEERKFNLDMGGSVKDESKPLFQVVIERCVVYEVRAFDEKDAEDMAWALYSNDDLSDPFVAESLQIEEKQDA